MRTTTNQQSITAIVLKSTPYKENDLLVSIYSLEYGKMTVLARGARKMKSKNNAGSQSMILTQMDILLKKGISTLIRSMPLEYYRHMKEDIELEIIGSVILEYYYRYVEENKPLLEDFEFLKESLYALNNGYSSLSVYLLFLAFVLKKEGVDLMVDHCVYCDEKKVVSISLNGGFVCAKHLGHLKPLDRDVLVAFRHFCKYGIKDIDKLQYSYSILKQLLKIFDYYIEEYAGILFKSKVFIDDLYK